MNRPPLHVIAINGASRYRASILPHGSEIELYICAARSNFAILTSNVKNGWMIINVNYRFAFKTINIFSEK